MSTENISVRDVDGILKYTIKYGHKGQKEVLTQFLNHNGASISEQLYRYLLHDILQYQDLEDIVKLPETYLADVLQNATPDSIRRFLCIGRSKPPIEFISACIQKHSQDINFILSLYAMPNITYDTLQQLIHTNIFSTDLGQHELKREDLAYIFNAYTTKKTSSSSSVLEVLLKTQKAVTAAEFDHYAQDPRLLESVVRNPSLSREQAKVIIKQNPRVSRVIQYLLENNKNLTQADVAPLLEVDNQGRILCDSTGTLIITHQKIAKATCEIILSQNTSSWYNHNVMIALLKNPNLDDDIRCKAADLAVTYPYFDFHYEITISKTPLTETIITHLLDVAKAKIRTSIYTDCSKDLSLQVLAKYYLLDKSRINKEIIAKHFLHYKEYQSLVAMLKFTLLGEMQQEKINKKIARQFALKVTKGLIPTVQGQLAAGIE